MTDITFDEKTCLNVNEALELEWLDTNGSGGYASSSIIMCHTRKYHGLLVADIPEAAGRCVLFSKVEDSLIDGHMEISLACHRYPGVIHPKGYKYQKQFTQGECPRFTYQIGNTTIYKSIMLVRGENRVLMRYDCEQPDVDLVLRIRPFIAFRGFHDLSRENLFIHVKTYAAKNGFKIQPYEGMPPLFVQVVQGARFYPSPLWYRNFLYLKEMERGYDGTEDLFQPGLFELRLREGRPVILAAGAEEFKSSLNKKWEAEANRRLAASQSDRETAEGFKLSEDEDIQLLKSLLRAGRHFLIAGQEKIPAIIAGYPWFGVWGRDTLISLPGLTFCSGRPDLGIAILREMGKHQCSGLLPNFFAVDERRTAYNAVDTSLWYFWAVQQMIKYTNDFATVKDVFWPVMKSILNHYLSGTHHHIYVSENGLLHSGAADTQLTWMDAMADGRPVTPRSGYAVEINALWYNALCFVANLSERFGEREFLYEKMVTRVRNAFEESFWIEDGQYLGDVASENGLDTSVRPNQIFAVSLPYSPIDTPRWQGVVERVRSELLTPFGLRTLSPRNVKYRGRYEGDASSRDSAYHQGTAWYWLIGHFGEALLRTAGDKKEARAFLLAYLRTSLTRHLREGGLGLIGEIFDGDPPHRPDGCIAQAWSTAEAIRLYSLLGEIP